MKIKGKLVDIHSRSTYPVVITIEGKNIAHVEVVESAPEAYILPGLIDAHIHIESSMITPGAFASAAVRHGTVAVVSDPHEIANVLGIRGVDYMIEDGKKVPLRFFFGAPSCVPATSFESSGSAIDSDGVNELLEREDILYLSEMMNFPGVIFGDEDVMRKLKSAQKQAKPVDGHAPGLRGEDLIRYVKAGISTDHECSSLEEAREKIGLGMKILIREGSAARNLDDLKGLLNENPDMLMLCSDDLHPEMLQRRHINKLISRLISEGFDKYDVIRCATLNVSEHYGLNTGMTRAGDRADLVIVDSPESMNVLETWIAGEKVFDRGKVLFDYLPGEAVNNFRCTPVTTTMLQLIGDKGRMRVIEAFDGLLETREVIYDAGMSGDLFSDPENVINKIVIKERYNDGPPSVAFIKGFGLKRGAFASSIAHDSHNIICVGTTDEDIASAINEVIRQQGGLSVSENGAISSLALNIAGIMTTRSCEEVAGDYLDLSNRVKSLGCSMAAPFMTLSFMALLVIPELKISDRGLFDVRKFQPVSLFLD